METATAPRGAASQIVQTTTCHRNAHFQRMEYFFIPAFSRHCNNSSFLKALKTDNGASYCTIDERENACVNHLIE